MREHLRPLTGLRFFAAALIVIHHTRWYFGYGNTLAGLVGLDIGVSIFYILSGFILAYSYRDISTGSEAAGFLVARIARIWPLHFATWLMVFVFLPYPWGPAGTDVSAAVLNLLLLQSWVPFPNYFFSFNAVAWSLSVEMFFYCLFPLLIHRWNRSWWWKIALSAFAAFGLIRYASLSGLPNESPAEILSIEALVYISPLARLFEFVIGIGACSVWLRARPFLSTLSRSQSSALELFAVSIGLAAMHWSEPIAWGLAADHVVSPVAARWLSEGGIAPVLAFAICILAGGRGVICGLFSLGIVVLLGEISFSIYMTHQILMRVFMQNQNLSIFGGMRGQYLAFWSSVLLVSFLLWKFVEKPCRKGLIEFAGRSFLPQLNSVRTHRVTDHARSQIIERGAVGAPSQPGLSEQRRRSGMEVCQ
jgi:peptidoglycan/LPS O-acetylase OafA/YrhL